MMIQRFSPVTHTLLIACLGLLAGIGTLNGCGGGGGGGGGTNTPAGNQAPTASITSPAGTYFKEGENIVFTGSATDAEDGQLGGSALVWTSSMDGSIGTGSTLVTSALSVGDHEVTLSATDSSGQTFTTPPLAAHVEQTRFIKMGFQTSGVPDAPNAFDGDLDTAATVMTVDTEYIHFRAHIGANDKFIFKIKLGEVSATGSRLLIEGLLPDGSWQYISEAFLFGTKTVVFKVENEQLYRDADGYINLRARWVDGQSPDNVTIYEIWRIDPIYPGPATQEVTNPESAFDEDVSSFATIAGPWNPLAPQGNRNFLQFKAYVGDVIANTFTFSILMNSIGPSHDFVIEVDDLTTPATDDWKLLKSLALNTPDARTVTIADVQNFLDADGYISLRGSWVSVSTDNPGNSLNIYEISRIDPFFVGSKTTFGAGWILTPESAVDGNPGTAASLYYFWGEFGRYDFLHVQAYAGDASIFNLSIQSAPSAPGSQSDLIVEGEREPDNWSLIDRIPLDIARTTMIGLTNARQYVDAQGVLNLRLRWESDSLLHDAYVYEIQRGAE